MDAEDWGWLIGAMLLEGAALRGADEELSPNS